MERDLEAMSHNYRRFSESLQEPLQFVQSSQLGLVKPRSGGLPMRITYFMTPSEILSLGTETQTLEQIANRENDHETGLSVTLALEASHSPNLVPITSMVTRSNVVPLSSANSKCLNARFVLKLNKPMVIEVSKCLELQRLTDMQMSAKTKTPLMQHIVKTYTNNQLGIQQITEVCSTP